MAYASDIEIFVGLEIDWIRPSSRPWINDVLGKYQFDLFVGSIHHVHTIPIDYDHEMYTEARRISGGTDERLFVDYFDLQFDMLQALKPPIVGHFDLIRLKSDDPDVDCLRWDIVQQRVLRNLDFVIGYGGLMELSSAALRKGLKEPYPGRSICKVGSVRSAMILHVRLLIKERCILPKEANSHYLTIAMVLIK